MTGRDPYQKIDIGVDFGVSDATVFTVCATLPGHNGLHIPMEWYHKNGKNFVIGCKGDICLQVNVHLHGILRDKLLREAKGRASITLDDGATVGDLMAQLGIKRRVVIVLNDEQEPDETYILQDGDQISIYTIIGGG